MEGYGMYFSAGYMVSLPTRILFGCGRLGELPELARPFG
jgi:hypothetical protein